MVAPSLCLAGGFWGNQENNARRVGVHGELFFVRWFRFGPRKGYLLEADRPESVTISLSGLKAGLRTLASSARLRDNL